MPKRNKALEEFAKQAHNEMKQPADNQQTTDPVADINFSSPLANRVRPRTLKEFVGQSNLVGPKRVLRKLIESDQIPSMIFWGPPGCGKTTLAEIIAKRTKARFIQFSAADASIRDVKSVMQQAEVLRKQSRKVIVFIDEIHRFNKSQQDAFLPYVEKGTVTLIGATTENPSFSVNSALLSRCKVFVLHQLTDDNVLKLLKHALKSPYGFPKLNIQISLKGLKLIANFANGDARKALNTLAMSIDNGQQTGNTIKVTTDDLVQLTGRKFLLYDKKGDEHYDLISALHKSVRNSDVDSALYWLYRMLDGGEDPVYIARRVVRMSSEDVGLADPNALTVCVSAFQTCQLLGMPECRLALVEAVVRLALDPKSNSLLKAGERADADVHRTMNQPVPLQIRNAPTKLMNDLGYKHGYKYAEDFADHTTAMETRPKAVKNDRYYYPSSFGDEAACQSRLKQLKEIKLRHLKFGDKRIN